MKSNTNNILGGAASNIGKSIINATKKENEVQSIVMVFLNLIPILFLSGAAGMQAIFRGCSKQNKIEPVAAVLCAVFFFLISYWSVRPMDFGENGLDTFSRNPVHIHLSNYVLSIFYGILAAFILIKTYLHYKRTDFDTDENDLFAFLQEYHSSLRIQQIIEPLYVIYIGTLFWLYKSWLAGMPLIYCGVAMWIDILLERRLLKSSVQGMKVELQSNRPSNSSSNQVVD